MLFQFKVQQGLLFSIRTCRSLIGGLLGESLKKFTPMNYASAESNINSFSTIPTVVGNGFGSQRVSVAMAMIVTGWGGGYLMVGFHKYFIILTSHSAGANNPRVLQLPDTFSMPTAGQEADFRRTGLLSHTQDAWDSGLQVSWHGPDSRRAAHYLQRFSTVYSDKVLLYEPHHPCKYRGRSCITQARTATRNRRGYRNSTDPSSQRG